MSLLANIAETRRFGDPVVGVFRTALGRDPSIHELRDGVSRLRCGAVIADLATSLIATLEFRARYDAVSDPDFVAALCANAFGPAAPATAATAMGAALQASRADILAAISSVALAQGRIPLLPGLTPGAPPDDLLAYQLWVDAYGKDAPPSRMLVAPQDGPCVSIVLSVGDTNTEAAIRTMTSLQEQSYGNWRLHLCIRTLSPWSGDALAEACRAERRISTLQQDELWRAWLAEPAVLACWLSPGDRLPSPALLKVVQTFEAHPETALLYTDEDVEEGGVRHSPRLKPAYSPTKCSTDLIGQLAVYRTSLLANVNLSAIPQTQAELVRQAAALAGYRRVRHLPGVLCHRAESPDPLILPTHPSRPTVPHPAPLVTVIVPSRDRAALLRACMDGLLDRTDYPAFEVIIVDNGSCESDAVTLLAELARDVRVRVMQWPGPFNFPAMNNAAAAEAHGDILLLLNNDIDVLHPDWMEEMVARVMPPDVGVVGARLLYPSGTVQHAGILLGPEGRATHVGRGRPTDDPGYLGQLACVRDLSAVTGACLAVRTEVWRQVGGMDERLAVTWNDVDLCLKVRQHGLRVVWTPHATLIHKESATRGLEAEDPARVRRFREEQGLVRAKWGDAVDHDPFLNPNLVATEAGPLCLAPPRKRGMAGDLPTHSEGGISPRPSGSEAAGTGDC